MSAPPRRPIEMADWCRRHLALALGLGLGLGVVGQVLVHVLSSGREGTFALAAAAVLYTAVGWAVLGLTLAALTQPLLKMRSGRVVALGLSVTTLALVALTQLMGVVLRVLSGAYLTSGAVMFSLNSSDHFLHAAAGNYWGIAAALVTTFFLLGAFNFWMLHSAAMSRTGPWPPPKMIASGAVLAALLVVVYQKRADSDLLRRMFASGPLVALVGSLDATSSVAAGQYGSRAPKAPPLSDGETWKSSLATARGPRPNVLLLMLESVGIDHLSYRGYGRPTTPHLDRLARGGLDMTRAWSTATHSNYSQMAILSSLFPRRGHGLDVYDTLDYPRVLFHDVFHLLGYETATISSQDEYWQGMRRFQDTGTPTFYWHSEDYQGSKLDTGTERVVPDGATLDMIVDWLNRDRNGPWALYVNFQATHFPYLLPSDAARLWEPDEPTRATFNYLRYPESEREIALNRYDNALAYVDQQIGKLVGYLESTNQLDDTLLVVTSDHGEAFFHKGLVTHGKTLYDFEARVPLIVHWPRHIESETRDDPVSNLDLMPTVLDFLEVPPHPSYQGRSFRTLQPDHVEPIYMNIQGLRFAEGIICWPYKFVFDRTDTREFLFDLSRDPHEEENLIERDPARARKLAETLNAQLQAQLDYHLTIAVRSSEFQPRLNPCPSLQ